ncbi:PREDICTED: beta-glucuronidase-like [Amphimedon queenslandica]|uniref:Beta-glucuronidase n=1 Tax=Amphimedon queenslandica TaxID=400682 RepID=A0A1X7UPN4_AMPQE|nr:PREDICTED: beta-glucuronidase-like [Amphimedon queenslandica]|eukprot:XP_011404336.1 PREDICTED: beta-glucuronidase-like [Amphimedon queenslandica]
MARRMANAPSLLLVVTLLILVNNYCEGLLYPKDSSSRLVKDLDGIWHFRIDRSELRDEGFKEKWYSQALQSTGKTILMPVPASFNDITQDPSIRDYVGWAWYDRNFWVPDSWLDGKTRVVLRFGGAHYYTIVWVNGNEVMTHDGGHLPFEADIAGLLDKGQPNRVTVAVNNTLDAHTLPPAAITFHDNPRYSYPYYSYDGQFDFFNYAGIHRSVKLYTTPKAYISDISVVTELEEDGSASVAYTVMVGGVEGNNEATYEVSLSGVKDSGTVTDGLAKGTLKITDPTLWWPWTLSSTPGAMQSFQVQITTGGLTDVYRQSVGLREVKVTEDQFLINGKPFYFHGVSKHEDWDILGKGINDALLMKDINLLKWMNVAAFRTSHYPYAEEMLDLCDKEGIVVIGESPAVGLQLEDNFANVTLHHHLEVMREMITRDKNHPSVVMWSIANEPHSDLPVAENYFKTVAFTTRDLDPSRPITFACNQAYYSDKANQFMDVIMLNRYFNWYDNNGRADTAADPMRYELQQWREVHKKPIMISEYGAGAIAGFHKDPPVMWTEEFQLSAIMDYWPVFDEFRKTFFIGELIWNFADFQTAQAAGRVDGNRKGLLTRERQPKLAAHAVKQRYLSLWQGN